jgi:hypothetical protein
MNGQQELRGTFTFKCMACGELPGTGALYALELESVPFYCPGCGKCYCLAHWRTWNSFDSDGWHDSFRGVCPHGHQRMLLD